MLRKAFYHKIEAFLNTTAQFLDRKGITPNQLTLGGLGLAFLTGWVYSGGHLFWGGILLIVSSLADMFDGPLARTTGKASKFGAFLDSTIDRYADFFVFSGLALHYALTGRAGWSVVTLGILMGAQITSYAKARAENLIPDCSVGVFERPERIIGLALGSLFSPLMPLALLVLLVGTHVTAIHRILHTHRNLESR